MSDSSTPHIGTLGEKSLHAALKAYLAQPGDAVEVRVDGFVIDLQRGDQLIEIQTGSFARIKRKLYTLTATHPVRLVYPVACEKWIVRLGEGDQRVSRRKSPKRRGVTEVFRELVSFPGLLAHANFVLDVLLVQQEEILRDDGAGSWRRKGWSIADQRLLAVVEQRRFAAPEDFLSLLPPELPHAFTSKQLAGALGIPARLAQQMTYCLREMDVITQVGKRGRAYLYTTIQRRHEGSSGPRGKLVRNKP